MKMNVPHDENNEIQVSMQIVLLQKEFKRFCEHSLEPYELTGGLYFYLIYIGNHTGCALNEISQVMKVDDAHTTRVIAHLVKKGFVEKKKSETDGRMYCLSLTGEGAAILKKIRNLFDSWDQSLQGCFSLEEWGLLKSLLRKAARYGRYNGKMGGEHVSKYDGANSDRRTDV